MGFKFLAKDNKTSTSLTREPLLLTKSRIYNDVKGVIRAQKRLVHWNIGDLFVSGVLACDQVDEWEQRHSEDRE